MLTVKQALIGKPAAKMNTFCVCVCCYLQCLVKPAVGAVVLAASSVQHLDGSGAAAGVLGDSGHGSVQAQSEDAALDGSHRLSVGLIWTPHTHTHTNNHDGH